MMPLQSFYNDSFGIETHTNVKMLLNQQTKPFYLGIPLRKVYPPTTYDITA